MPNCEEIEPSLASYVDGACAATDRNSVEAHLQGCPSCRARVASERTAHELLCARRQKLRGCASDTLRQRCAALRAAGGIGLRPGGTGRLGRSRWIPLSLAATLVLAAATLFLFGIGSSVDTYAAQLAADHVRCFQTSRPAGPVDADALGRSWHAANGWPLRVAPGAETEHLELIAMRRCGSPKGQVAHVLYRWQGEPLSLYVLNDRTDVPDTSLGEDIYAVKKLGEQELIWSDKGRTYAVVGRASVADLQRVAAYFRRASSE